MAETSRLQLVGQETDDLTQVTAPQESKINKIAGDALLLALTALSQRAIDGLSRLFTLLTVASAFVLWYVAPPDPNVYQLIKLALYGVFILGANLIVRRR